MVEGRCEGRRVSLRGFWGVEVRKSAVLVKTWALVAFLGGFGSFGVAFEAKGMS